MAIIRVDNLRLRTILGINPDERVNKQDILINFSMEVDIGPAAETDDVANTVDYKTMTKAVIEHVERSDYFLVETMVERLLDILMSDDRVTKASVRVDKPTALRFADSVSIEESRVRR
jgi:D-erythro-7,8-dihydroneopterin triphosphate epimerase